MTEKPDLIALVSSRICHDLVSPLGAIGNGVELIQMDPAAEPSPELALISQSVEDASARIRFFRIAFGAVGPDQRISRREITSILADLARSGRIETRWLIETDLSRQEVKVAFLLHLCLESAMPRGGVVEVAHDGTRWRIDAVSDDLHPDPALWSALARNMTPEAVMPAQVHFALVPEALAQQGRALAIVQSDGRITMTF